MLALRGKGQRISFEGLGGGFDRQILWSDFKMPEEEDKDKVRDFFLMVAETDPLEVPRLITLFSSEPGNPAPEAQPAVTSAPRRRAATRG